MDESGLNMRNWIIKKLDDNEFHNFKWRDRSQKLFQIPWNKQDQPNWDRECLLYKAWFERKGKSAKAVKPSKLKDQFRNALNKSNDFEEMESEHSMNKQINNYKVYRVLSREETIAKTEMNKRQKKLSKEGLSPASSSGSSLSPVEPGFLFTTQQQFPEAQVPQAPIPQLVPSIPMDVEEKLVSSSAQYFQPTLTQQVMESLNIPKEQLFNFNISMKYRNEPSGCMNYDFRQPHRILYGDDVDQIVLVVDDEGDYPDQFKNKAIEIHQYKGTDEKILNALKLLDQGISFRVDERGNLLGTRHCQAHVYFYEQTNKSQSTKMERNKEKLLFSHDTFIQQLENYMRNPNLPEPQTKVKIFVGTKPTTLESCGVVTLLLKSETAEVIKEQRSHASDLMFSDPNSVDHVLRKTEKMSLEK